MLSTVLLTIYKPLLVGLLMCSAIRADKAQSTVEAAYVLPIIFLLLLLLIQPGIMLYDRMVMQAAAAEGCRLLTTMDSSSGSTQLVQDYIKRRLGAVPPHDCFHIHDAGCSWVIETEGDETSGEVTVRISNQLKPLPAIDLASTLLGLTNDQGNFPLTVEVSAPTQPFWAAESAQGLAPGSWIGGWIEND